MNECHGNWTGRLVNCHIMTSILMMNKYQFSSNVIMMKCIRVNWTVAQNALTMNNKKNVEVLKLLNFSLKRMNCYDI